MIKVKREPEPGALSTVEKCCFCRKDTEYWYVPKDVACCPECAKGAEPDDVPSKRVWFRREQIAMGKREER